MKRYRITKIVYAKNMTELLKKEKRVEPVSIELDEPVEDPNEKTNTIGFRKHARRK